ncbi:CPBP family intramembrane metalloprotease [Cohnella sp. LGH]|uniref:CPBP family intramembrane glutamic endopeptidase n=1 Tax=Cohnella sp. LGH TaxID=1619153 RepID=UPI001ADCE3D0|nr:CPBP family intramembrane glutamic endopeptidase [Cohnella sp. LGH]QTH40672.1 CPBP family intramembrane metalloprotease [Cohnella sp. LGH]
MYSTLILALILVAICMPGVWLMSKHAATNLVDKPDNRLPKQSLFIVMFLQTIIIVNLAVSAGIYFGRKAGLTDPFLEGLGSGKLNVTNLIQQAGIGIVAGIICAVVWVVSYYAFIRPRLDTATVLASEQARQQLGLAARVASGGITEEIIFRWGLLSLTMWAVLWITTSQTIAFWISIVITGVIFGLAHLPGHIAQGCVRSPLLIASTVLGNLWVSIICGYLFWQFGIIAAIIVHMLFHIIWYPWELRYRNR